MTEADLRELASCLKYEKYEQGHCPVIHGDNSKVLRYINEGQLQIFTPNKQLHNWFWAISIYNCLREWKTQELDPLIEPIMRDVYQNYMANVRLVLNRKLKSLTAQ